MTCLDASTKTGTNFKAENTLKKILNELQNKKEIGLFKLADNKYNFCVDCKRKMCKDENMFEYFCPVCGLCKEIDDYYFTSFHEKSKPKSTNDYLKKNLNAFLGENVSPVVFRQVEIVLISLQEANPTIKKPRQVFFIPKILDLVLPAEDPIRGKFKQKHKEKPLTKSEIKNEALWNSFLVKHDLNT